ncbi:hypothetical protein LTR56_022552 [Elasticomyces elasticus]|nr:hypothetical protein LTR22_027255 [Elasticomyces elasticus]KAK3621816.1 hypothetical protein LTR56_022552 [Elasticomyces elasticus]KAK4898301.1 hypothetical protein LTR49_027848 [Elasticomyces elasticus]KAK5733958.1 hypothetical protein LTS12_026821 [Elasticomyces elasticus]
MSHSSTVSTTSTAPPSRSSLEGTPTAPSSPRSRRRSQLTDVCVLAEPPPWGSLHQQEITQDLAWWFFTCLRMQLSYRNALEATDNADACGLWDDIRRPVQEPTCPALDHHKVEQILAANYVDEGLVLLKWFDSPPGQRTRFDTVVMRLADALDDWGGRIVVTYELKEQFLRIVGEVMEAELVVSPPKTADHKKELASSSFCEDPSNNIWI